jgi:hypothetical protein
MQTSGDALNHVGLLFLKKFGAECVASDPHDSNSDIDLEVT